MKILPVLFFLFTSQSIRLQRNSNEIGIPQQTRNGRPSNWGTYLPPSELHSAHPDTGFRREWENILLEEQERITQEILSIEEGAINYLEDAWEDGVQGTENYGRGRSRIFQDGHIFSKGGVNVSIIHGILPKEAAIQMMSRSLHSPTTPSSEILPISDSTSFYAAGLSLVIHSRLPTVPTVHCNYRFFQLFKDDHPSSPAISEGGGIESTMKDPFEKKESLIYWFGGGTDLTPMTVNEEDGKYFHSVLKMACDKHGSGLYKKFKDWCDEYFYLAHRGENRGIGGIFFDDFNKLDDFRKTKNFAKDCLQSFVESYFPIVAKSSKEEYGDADVQHQLARLSRYVEFNLLYDRGTKFGLASGSNKVDNILMSLPKMSAWKYDNPSAVLKHSGAELGDKAKGEEEEIQEGKDEAKEEERLKRVEKTLDILKNPIEWLGEEEDARKIVEEYRDKYPYMVGDSKKLRG